MSHPPDSARALPSSRLPSVLPPLLRLPPYIRQRIYRHLRLASWNGRSYRFNIHAGWLKLRHGSHEWGWGDDAPDPSCFHGLLLSCHTIHAEATALLYSANQFVFHYFDPVVDLAQPASLPPLHNLHVFTALSLGSLSNIKIVLNEAGCHHPTLYEGKETCCAHGREELRDFGKDLCKRKHKSLHQLPLLSANSGGLGSTQAMLREWHSAAARLLSHSVPGRLGLSVVCDIDAQHPHAVDLANSVLAPIRDLPQGYLGECHIRLAKTTDHRLRQLAEETVSHATGILTVIPILRPPSNAAAALLALPRELRIGILQHTDLVAPSWEVVWSRKDRAYTVIFKTYDQLSACWYDTTGTGPPNKGCFCRRHHAGFSKQCTCWAPPGPALFLVCRTLYEEAQFVFFSSNRFIIHDYQSFPPWVLPVFDQYPNDYDGPVPAYPYPEERFAISEFLREVIPTPSLAHLRFLELVFPPYRAPSWPGTQDSVMQDWRETIDWLRQQKINLPGLTIRLVVADTYDAAAPTYYRTITVEDGDVIMTAYQDLLQPLVRLAYDGLFRFYADLRYPWAFTEESKIRRKNGMGWRYEEERALKQQAERYVMGHRYESLYANGREEPKPSDWDERYSY
ncbi:hypothetical protein B0I37DRAFT_235423 [Chaetomium sp. MPI-CAGE-AT-0009]|nr:hypothetical protein B0I37DRAFT_235423 [Chaetomium sp. MPI-CAGE-AT-0009]